MNLPGGIPAGMLRHLADLRLERPVTDRVELLALLGFSAHACRHERAQRHQRLFLHARRPEIIRAMELVSAATHTPASPRRSADIIRTVAYLCDFPGDHRGNISGLARKSARWHRDAAGREAAAVLERLGDRPAALPPVPLPPIAGVTFLDSVGRIVDEGAVMGHCAADYAQDAVTGNCYLFHLEHDGEMATAEISPDGLVVQVQGPHNQDNGAVRWGRRALARWARDFPSCVPSPARAPLPPGADPWAPYPDDQPF